MSSIEGEEGLGTRLGYCRTSRSPNSPIEFPPVVGQTVYTAQARSEQLEQPQPADNALLLHNVSIFDATPVEQAFSKN